MSVLPEEKLLVVRTPVYMGAHNPSRDEAAPREEQSKPSNEQANAEAASKRLFEKS
jgi:hypothetical protein